MFSDDGGWSTVGSVDVFLAEVVSGGYIDGIGVAGVGSESVAQVEGGVEFFSPVVAFVGVADFGWGVYTNPAPGGSFFAAGNGEEFAGSAFKGGADFFDGFVAGHCSIQGICDLPAVAFHTSFLSFGVIFLPL